MTKRLTQRGFTLLETIVVAAIVASMLGLTLPGIQAIRASADRARCKSNLRQIGFGLHQYHGTHEFLPNGLSRKRGDTERSLGWLPRILPWIEQEALWNQTMSAFREDPYAFHDPPHVGFSTVVKFFVCPTDPMSQTAQYETVYNKYYVALCDYLGSSGTDFRRRDGVLYGGSRVTLGEITDGTSSTLLVGERPPSPDYVWGWWYAASGQNGDGSGDTVLGVRELNGRPDMYIPPCQLGPDHFRPGTIDDTCHYLHFWSLHPGGAHFAFCDGSVRFLAYSADPIMPALATRAGGEAVNPPD